MLPQDAATSEVSLSCISQIGAPYVANENAGMPKSQAAGAHWRSSLHQHDSFIQAVIMKSLFTHTFYAPGVTYQQGFLD